MSDFDTATVRQFLQSLDAKLPPALKDEESLIRSGLLDSSALFDLLLWVEQQTGTPLDPTRFDFLTEFDSINGIARYLGNQTPD